jgi:hypothetical protein
MNDQNGTGYSLEQMRVIRFALSALEQRVGILSRSGIEPSLALEATALEVRTSPVRITEWVPLEQGVNEDMPALLRHHSDLIHRVINSLKCCALIRIFEGEEPQEAIRIAIKEYMKAAND